MLFIKLNRYQRWQWAISSGAAQNIEPVLFQNKDEFIGAICLIFIEYDIISQKR